ncbi:hypothetical protein L596_011550 [Steinernema carpocapsae]|uniref:Uncharacterized protein n=1 Tax=Steinernema carpocapsae TaxID=34508 RepID=A0A4V6A4J0_STECR|nr:hypothetical protein L596_011550 [Steinernema carpocapsae]
MPANGSDSESYSLTEDILTYKLSREAISSIAETKKSVDVYFSLRKGVPEPVKEHEQIKPIEVDDFPGYAEKFDVFNMIGNLVRISIDYTYFNDVGFKNYLKSTGSDFDMDGHLKEFQKKRAASRIAKLKMLKEIARHTAEMSMLCLLTRRQNSLKPGYRPPRTLVPESKTVLKNAMEAVKKDYERLEKERKFGPSEKWKRLGLVEYLPPHDKNLDVDRMDDENLDE